jgi:hypothetical protein
MWPAKRVLVLILGLLPYLISFALSAVNHAAPLSGSEPGYTCALVALTTPWARDNLPNTPNGLPALAWISLVLSGWINPLFLVTMLCHKWSRIFRVLRIVLFAMLPSCLIFIHFANLFPREGYFLWVGGIVLALFAADSQRMGFESA